MVLGLPPTPAKRQSVFQYRPVGAIAEIVKSRDPEVLGVGPAGTGKTLGFCWKGHLMCLRYPGTRGAMLRKTLESLKSGALNTYINGVKPTQQGVTTFGGNKFFPAEFRYPNGSVIMVFGMDKADKLLSAEFDWIYANEVTELTEVEYETAKSRLRNGAMPYRQMMSDCNPSGPRHWMNVRCNEGKTRRINTTHKDNPAYWDSETQDWTEIGREYVMGTLANLSGVQRKRFFEGVWAAAEGLVYPEFSPEMIRTVDVTGWRTVMGVDVGSRNPTAILTAHIAGDGRIHISRELYRRNMSSTDILSAIEAEADATSPDTIYIDPSAKGYIEDLWRDGYPAEGAVNDILVGIQRVHGALQTGLTVDPSCTSTIDEFGMYAYPDNPRIETDKPKQEHDHCLIAGTLIETDAGPVPIERVQAGDRVLTRSGYRRVLASGISGLDAEVYTVALSNGATLTGTGNHRVWDAGRRDWTRIDTLRYGDIMEGIQEVPSCGSKSSSTRASSSADTPILRTIPTDRITARMPDMSGPAWKRCIAKFGRITTALSLPAITSIMSMAIPAITTFPILSALLRLTTSSITAHSQRHHASGSIWIKFATLQPNGIARKRAGHGIGRTVEMRGKGESRYASDATNAGVSSMTSRAGQAHDSVRTTASRHGGAPLASMTRTASASFAELASNPTSTARFERVPVHVVGISKAARRQVVYDLTVDGEHEFYANGLLVHNSMDAIRYLCMGAAEPVLDLKDFFTW